MTGNVGIDITIGLIFIYLLYSLLATVLMEIFSTLISLRALNLRYSIYRMLRDSKDTINEEHKHNYFIRFLESRFMGLFRTTIRYFGMNLFKLSAGDINNSKWGLFNNFYNRPSIKYLSEGGMFSKPSYISPQNFSKALIDVLKEEGKKDPSQKTEPLEEIQKGIDQISNENKETKQHIKGLLSDANGDLQKFKLLLEQWFDDTQKRAIGWFKRKTQVILLLIGFIIAVSFNVNTIEITKKLSVDKDARDKLVAMAIDFDKKYYDSDSATQRMYKKSFESMDSARVIIQEQMEQTSTLLSNENKPLWPIHSDFWVRLWSNFFGLALTALAISLGAPFWFDLLNRFIKIRSTGTKQLTQEDSTSSKNNETSILNRKG